jgi:hypothetical protein
MNPAGIVHAADSATTVTDSADGKAQTRYFKGANKILLLSHHKPVALMTFGSADLQGLPWETITKEFSNSLRDKSFNHAEDYAKLDFPQFGRAGRPEMMSLAMPYDGLLGELVPPVDRPSGGVGMRWRRSIEDTCAAGATRFYGCDDDTSLSRRCGCGAGATGPRHLVVRLP